MSLFNSVINCILFKIHVRSKNKRNQLQKDRNLFLYHSIKKEYRHACRGIMFTIYKISQNIHYVLIFSSEGFVTRNGKQHFS